MDIGYSLLLGEYVQADEVDYGDCEDFMVVCPACKDTIFKCERVVESRDEITHYLSHRNGKQGVSDCENRVSALTAQKMVRHNAQGRGQTLVKFLAAVKSLIKESFIATRTAHPNQEIWKSIIRIKCQRFTKCRYFDLGTDGDLCASFNRPEFISDIPMDSPQKRVLVTDILGFIYRGGDKTRDLRYLLFCIACFDVINHPEITAGWIEQLGEQLGFDPAGEAVAEVMLVFRELYRTPPRGEPLPDLVSKIAPEVYTTIVGYWIIVTIQQCNVQKWLKHNYDNKRQPLTA